MLDALDIAQPHRLCQVLETTHLKHPSILYIHWLSCPKEVEQALLMGGATSSRCAMSSSTD